MTSECGVCRRRPAAFCTRIINSWTAGAGDRATPRARPWSIDNVWHLPCQSSPPSAPALTSTHLRVGSANNTPAYLLPVQLLLNEFSIKLCTHICALPCILPLRVKGQSQTLITSDVHVLTCAARIFAAGAHVHK